MKFKLKLLNSILVSLLLSICCFVNLANAGIILNDSVTNDYGSSYIGNAGEVNGVFDITSLLIGAGLNSQYTISDLSISFLFADDYDLITTTQYNQGSYNYSTSNSSYCNSSCSSNGVAHTHYNTYDYYAGGTLDYIRTDLIDIASVNIAGSLFDFNSLEYSSLVTWTGNKSISSSNTYCNGYTGHTTCHNRKIDQNVAYTDSRSGYGGQNVEFGSSVSLGSNGESELENFGTLNYKVSAKSGDFYLKSTTLSFTATAVPEPSTIAIFALGMIGLASRRFKKKS